MSIGVKGSGLLKACCEHIYPTLPFLLSLAKISLEQPICGIAEVSVNFQAPSVLLPLCNSPELNIGGPTSSELFNSSQTKSYPPLPDMTSFQMTQGISLYGTLFLYSSHCAPY
jgi:hypothetical protein